MNGISEPATAALDSGRESDNGLLIHQLFEQQVNRAADAIAVTHEGESLTYGALNERANQLARELRERGVTPDTLVGICVERSLEMVVGLLGILKAGGAYVPLDPSYPSDRLAYMLEDAAPKIVLTQERLRAALPAARALVMALDSGWSEIAHRAADNLSPQALGLRPGHLAYVIYTSGSTGRPKGAMNEHRAVSNRIVWMQEEYGLGPADRVLQKTPFSFDVSVWEFFWTLMSGARLVVARPDGHRDPAYLEDLIERTGVTTLHFVPSMLQAFLQQHRAGRCPTLRHVVCSGEELSPALQNRCLALLPQARLSNLYGPTECAVDVTSWECVADADCRRVPIGRPIANTQIHILDDRLAPVPVGEAGEIFIAGVAVGRGYWNRPELTAERFVRDPFSPDPRARMYKTGDLGRWRPDGAVEYLGRNDHQVKIRGFRIELGEIETRLAQHPQVQDAVVLAREDAQGEKRLVAYLVARDPLAPPALEELRTHMQVTLPEHMVPSAFVVLRQFPTSPNGKLDRKALPAPDAATYLRRPYQAPQGPLEEGIAEIWQALLRVARIGRDENFFEVGGHSLLALELRSRVQERLGVEIPLSVLIEAPTIERLAARIAAGSAGDSMVLLRAGQGEGEGQGDGQGESQGDGHSGNQSDGQGEDQGEDQGEGQGEAEGKGKGKGGVPLFLVHDGDGETLLYRTLSLRLHRRHTVYGLHPLALPGAPLAQTRIPDMAAYHIAKVRSVQPRGPYLLGGMCAGAVIAFEMALQLQAQGERVALVALLDAADTQAVLQPYRETRKRLQRMAGELQRAQSLSAVRRAGLIAGRFAAKLRNFVLYQLRSASAGLRDAVRLRLARAWLDRQRPPPKVLGRIPVRKMYLFAAHQYRPLRQFAGELVLFRATQGVGLDAPFIDFFADPALGWGRRGCGGVRVIDVPGGHTSMLQEPNVRVLADRLQEEMDRALAGGARPARSRSAQPA